MPEIIIFRICADPEINIIENNNSSLIDLFIFKWLLRIVLNFFYKTLITQFMKVLSNSLTKRLPSDHNRNLFSINYHLFCF